MEENKTVDLVKLADVYSYVMNALPELYIKYLEKRSSRVITHKALESDPMIQFFDGQLTSVEQTYSELAKILGISQTLSERISELNL